VAGTVTIGTSPLPPVSTVSPAFGTSTVYVGDTFVTPAAAAVSAGTLTVYVGPADDNGADFEVLVTDVTSGAGFHPTTLLFQSGTLNVPLLPLTRVPYAYAVDLGGLARAAGA
jgi:hypothetical protein